MNKTVKIYLSLLIVLFVAAVAIEFSQPEPIDWNPTYNEEHSKPYGLKVFREELASIMQGQEIEDIKTTPYQYFDENYNWADSLYNVEGSYMYINRFYRTDDISTQELLDFAAHGNTVFITSGNLPPKLRDSLGVDVSYALNRSTKARTWLANPAFRGDSIKVEKGAENAYFSKIDSTRSTVLGYQEFKEKRINFIKVKTSLRVFLPAYTACGLYQLLPFKRSELQLYRRCFVLFT